MWFASGDDAVSIDVLGNGSRYLWAHYKHMPTMAGWCDYGTSSTVGAQSGANKLGSYYCWNRVYDIATGRWTTPDPAASPWSNLQDYVGNSPLSRVDLNGLDDGEDEVDGDTRTGVIDGVLKFEMEGCECCYSDKQMDWFKQKLADAYWIIRKASTAADSLKQARQKGQSGWGSMGFAKDGSEHRVLKAFKWDSVNVATGEESTEYINRIQDNLDEMFTHIHENGWEIECYCDKDSQAGGKTQGPWFFDGWATRSTVLEINCCDKFGSSKSNTGSGLVNTLIHELSHAISGTDDYYRKTDKGLASAHDAYFYGDLAETFSDMITPGDCPTGSCK